MNRKAKISLTISIIFLILGISFAIFSITHFASSVLISFLGVEFALIGFFSFMAFMNFDFMELEDYQSQIK
jgi:hypothetical protein